MQNKPVIWSPRALTDLALIVESISADSPLAARRLSKRIRASVRHTGKYPYMYPVSERFPAWRRVVAHPNYIVYYAVTETRIEVTAVYHARADI